MLHRSSAFRYPVAAALGLTLTVAGCGQVTVGEQSTGERPPSTTRTDAPDPSATGPRAAGTTASGAPSTTPSPGPGATPGCELLTEPVYRLVVDEGDTEADSEEARRLAAGVEDNALSALASRISGLAVQPTVDSAVLDEQWRQFTELCDMD